MSRTQEIKKIRKIVFNIKASIYKFHLSSAYHTSFLTTPVSLEKIKAFHNFDVFSSMYNTRERLCIIPRLVQFCGSRISLINYGGSQRFTVWRNWHVALTWPVPSALSWKMLRKLKIIHGNRQKQLWTIESVQCVRVRVRIRPHSWATDKWRPGIARLARTDNRVKWKNSVTYG